MRITTWLGFAAGILTTVSFVPQVLHAWRSKRCDDPGRAHYCGECGDAGAAADDHDFESALPNALTFSTSRGVSFGF